MNHITTAKNKHLPIKEVKYHKHKHKCKPWITTGIVRSIKFRDKMYSRMKLTNPNTNLYLTLKTNLKTYNGILNMIHTAKENYYCNQFDTFKKNMKKTWETVKSLLNISKSKRNFPAFFLIENTKVTNKEEIANHFNNFL